MDRFGSQRDQTAIKCCNMKLLCLLLLTGAIGAFAAEDNLVCYFSSWARYRPDWGMFDVEDIDPFLCTHIMFSFTGLSNQTWEIEVLDPWNELCPDEPGGHYCAFERTVALKEINQDLIVMVAIGGWNEGSEDYSVMAADPHKRYTFVTSVVRLVTKYGFDGLDFDWEYPAARGGAPEDTANFVTLASELRAAFDKFNPPLKLSGAFAAGKETIDISYDIPKLVESFDLFHIMAYDYHGAFENFTHHNAPLCPHYLDEEKGFPYFNVMYTMQYYLDLGVPKEKAVLGVPTYGRTYTLDDIDEHGVYAPASKAGHKGPYIQIDGFLGFNEICERIKNDKSCTVVHDPSLNEPYMYCTSDNIWASYDDAESLRLKAVAAKNKGLSGLMVWQIDTDDFRPRCYQESFHLIKSAKKAFAEGGEEITCDYVPPSEATTPTTQTPTTRTTRPPTTPTTQTPTTPTTQTPTTPTTQTPTTPTPTTQTPTTPTPSPTTPSPSSAPTTMSTETTTPHGGGRPDCTLYDEGTFFRHYDCDKYWQCVNQQALLRECAPGTFFDITIPVCNNPEEVELEGCRFWECSVDGTVFPAKMCNQYWRCYNGAQHLETCAEKLYWSQPIKNCDIASHVDTSLCDIPA